MVSAQVGHDPAAGSAAGTDPRCTRRTPSDEALLEGVVAGDQLCFEALYHRHVALCRRRARVVLACDEWVQDVVQAVFLDVWTHAARFDPGRGSARRWLLQLTHHKAVDVVRVQQRQAGRAVHEELLLDHADAGSTPDDVVAAAEVMLHLRRHVQQLSALQREAVSLHFLGGLTQREAAQRLGVPVATLKTRAHRGIVALRKQLDRTLLQDT